MARLVNMWQGYHPAALEEKQMPLVVDENLAMVMDISGLQAICESPLVRGKQLDEFTRKLDMLTKEEVKVSFEVTCKDMLAMLDEAVPCIGCRRSVERLFYDLSNLNCHPALDPIIITSDGMLTLKDEVLQSPQRLCTVLHGNRTRLNDLVEHQPRNKKSRRCGLHSLEMQRMKPPPNAWREVWDCMEHECLKEITFIDTTTLDSTLDTYLRKHKFCGECRTKVLLASSLLTTETDPSKEKGYVSALYADIRRCTGGRHVHLPLNTEYISTIIGRAQPELAGRERHAKTLEIAQEEVLTCLGICVAERLHRVYRRLKEEESVIKVLAAVAIDTLSRNFQIAVEYKRGITQLEVLYEEFKKEEIVKQQRREKLRLKRKKKKQEKRFEAEEKENACNCTEINAARGESSEVSCPCTEPKPVSQNFDRHKLQVLDPKNKGPPTCKCSDCAKKVKISSKTEEQSSMQSTIPNKKTEKATAKKKSVKPKLESSNTKETANEEQSNGNATLVDAEQSECKSCDSCCVVKDADVVKDNKECNQPPSNELMDAFMDHPSQRYNMWIEVKKRFETKATNRNFRSSSEHSSQDCGYSSEHNLSSSSLPSTPEGSEVACSDSCCHHEGDCQDTQAPDKLAHSSSRNSLLRENNGGLTLLQMLEDSHVSDEEENDSYIPVEEVLEFKSRMCQVTEKRQELRRTLKKRFAMLCSHHKPCTIPR